MEQTSRVKFSIMGEEFVSCSKKCKKVTKFAYMLRQKNENEILCAFESMLRKKAFKKHQLGTGQNNNNPIYQTTVISNAMSANRSSLDNPSPMQHYETNRQSHVGGLGVDQYSKRFKEHANFASSRYLRGDEGEDELKALEKQ